MIIAPTRIIALVALFAVFAVSLWPMLMGQRLQLPNWATVPGASKLALILLALALASANARNPVLAQRLSLAATGLALLILLSWAATAIFGTPPMGKLAKILALRPPLLAAVGIAILGGAIAWRRVNNSYFDVSALLGTVAAAVFFLICLGHLFGADALIRGPGRVSAMSTGLGASLFLLIALAALTLHPAGPIAAYAGEGPGPFTKRRLLPAAVLTPIASGFVLLYALTGQQFSPTLAVALTVFANILVMLLLIDGAGNKVARVAFDRQARVEAREARVRQQGLRDPMTALLNRRGWDAEVQAGEKRCRNELLEACVVVIDLDGLKRVNDSEGHKAGDAFIHRAAHALRKAARRGDALARLGGDEFAYLAVGCDEAMARAVVARFQDALRVNKVSASVGYALRRRRSLPEAIEEADQLMYAQKRARQLKRA